MIKEISILGSTGSIGTQTLNVCKMHGIRVCAISGNQNIELLEQQARQFNPLMVCVYDDNKATKLKKKLNDTNIKVVSGIDGLCEVATHKNAQAVVTAVVGMIGLLPTVEAIKAKKIIALANKETLVCAGELVMREAKANKTPIIPVDSEHSAIFQCMQAIKGKKQIKRIILTASGGPFFGRDKSFLKSVKKEQALKHPNWTMGQKITIDSATMMNKGLELIEAMWLYNLPPSKIDIVIHRQSIIHSMVETIDNSILAQMGLADMQIPIQYALTYPKRQKSPVDSLDFTKHIDLTFDNPDEKNFEALALSRYAAEQKGLAGAVFNAANEAAVELFLNDKIGFLDITEFTKKALYNFKNQKNYTIGDIIKTDKNVREYVKNLCIK